MNENCCNNCNSCNSCNKCGGGCCPAKYDCSFNIEVSPYDPYTWLVTTCGMPHKVKVPKLPETCTTLGINGTDSTLVYKGECDTDIITGSQLGSIIRLNDLKDVDAPMPDHCSMLVFDPFCAECGDGCTSPADMWKPYSIPDAGDCEMELDEEGFYKVLVKDDCGCIKECKMPAASRAILNYVRDSVPDDSDFPWYYGNYNDHIGLHLRENAAAYFGKFDLKVTINYGVQTIKSDNYNYNYNWRSLVVPVIEGESVRTTQAASILQNWAMSAAKGTAGGQVAGGIPWGSSGLRGSLVFIVPKGKDAYLHHEFRLRSTAHFPNYLCTGADGQKAGDHLDLNSALYPASRLNALQVLVEPVDGSTNYSPVVDEIRNQLDAPVDSYDDGYWVEGC